MLLIPAIDILAGKVVRLHQGDYDRVTEYSDDPVAFAERFAGAERLHVVDLEAARQGKPVETDTVKRLIASVPMAVQVGGGIRDVAAAERWLELGAARVVLGTSAVKSPETVRLLCQAHPGRVVVALDAREGRIATEGWLESTELDVIGYAQEVDTWGVDAILCTAIERDGTGAGPAVDLLARLQQKVRCPVIASGGIGTLEDIRALDQAGIAQAVCGKALVEGRFTFAQAQAAAQGNGAPGAGA